jgi:GNAT superfamily N-acetyltransferase
LTLEVRRAEPAEYAALGEICVAAYRADGLGPGGYDAVLRDVAARAAAAEVLVGCWAGEPVGTVTLVLDGGPLHEISAPDEAEFRMLAVAPQGRGHGVGAALVTACADAARARGRRALICSSQDRMHAAHRLYARLGFVRAPERDWKPVPQVQLLAFELVLS